jgi:hypothetical protein
MKGPYLLGTSFIDLYDSVRFFTLSLLCSDPTPTFSHTAPSVYTPSYETSDTWDCITVVSDFPNIVPAHPLDILPHVCYDSNPIFPLFSLT